MARDITELDDDALEAAFEAAKAEMASPDTAVEEQYEDDSTDEVEDEDEFELEQPDEDSDDDTSDENETEEDDSTDPEEEEGEPDEDPEAEEEQPEEDVEEADEEKSQPAQAGLDKFLDTVTKTRANGVDYEFTNSEKLAMFDKMFPQATDYTKKMQQIKPWRKTIDAIEQAKLGQSDVNLMIDVLKGDKDAIAAVLKRTGVDALDLDVDNSDYVAKDYGRNDTELNIKDIVDEISGDPEYRVTHNVINKQWDEKSVEAFVEDPNMIRLLHTDVKSGVFDQVSPIANKLKIYDGGTKSDLDYYKMAAQQYFTRQKEQQTQAVAESTASAEAERVATEKSRIESVKATEAKRESTKSDSAKRKAATPTKKGGGTQKKVTDYLDDSDEAFEDWYNKVQDSH
jgi:hypothetical protein